MSSNSDKQAYAQMVGRHAGEVVRLAQRLLHDRRDAEEVAQDAFVKAYRALPTYRGDAPMLTWVMRIAYREALNRLRRQRPWTVDIESAVVADEFAALPTATDGDPTADREERISRLEEAVDRLAEDDQTLLHLYYYDDRPLREIAYIMDADPNALGVRLHRIRKKLQTMINESEHE